LNPCRISIGDKSLPDIIAAARSTGTRKSIQMLMGLLELQGNRRVEDILGGGSVAASDQMSTSTLLNQRHQGCA